MTRDFPLPAPARINTGPSLVSTASRCCGFSWSRKDKLEMAPGCFYFTGDRGAVSESEEDPNLHHSGRRGTRRDLAQEEGEILHLAQRPRRLLRESRHKRTPRDLVFVVQLPLFRLAIGAFDGWNFICRV